MEKFSDKKPERAEFRGRTYYFDSVRMSGQSTLTIAGPTKIYIAGRGMIPNPYRGRCRNCGSRRFFVGG